MPGQSYQDQTPRIAIGGILRAVAYRAAYLPITAQVIEMDTAGLCTANLARFPYQYLPQEIIPGGGQDRNRLP